MRAEGHHSDIARAHLMKSISVLSAVMCSWLFASRADRKKRISTRHAANQHTCRLDESGGSSRSHATGLTMGNTPNVAKLWLVEYAEWSRSRIAREEASILQDDTQAGCPTWACPSCSMIVALCARS